MHSIKIFAPGIEKCDLAYMDKVILMVRNWRSHNESWKKVFIHNVKVNQGKEVDSLNYPIGTEYCFKYSTIILDYLKRKWNLLIVDYDDLTTRPSPNMESIKKFLGCGRWDLSAKLVSEKYNHHKGIEIDNSEEFKDGFFSFLDRMYESMKSGHMTDGFIQDLKYWRSECVKEINNINKQIIEDSKSET